MGPCFVSIFILRIILFENGIYSCSIARCENQDENASRENATNNSTPLKITASEPRLDFLAQQEAVAVPEPVIRTFPQKFTGEPILDTYPFQNLNETTAVSAFLENTRPYPNFPPIYTGLGLNISPGAFRNTPTESGSAHTSLPFQLDGTTPRFNSAWLSSQDSSPAPHFKNQPITTFTEPILDIPPCFINPLHLAEYWMKLSLFTPYERPTHGVFEHGESSNAVTFDANMEVEIPLVTHCDECQQEFKSAKKYEKHASQRHPNKLIFPCAFQGCQRAFKRVVQLYEHRRYAHRTPKKYYKERDENELTCPKCLQRFQNPHQLSLHAKQNHKNEKLFGCRKCLVTFTTFLNREQHMIKYHSKDGPARCNFCNTAFIRIEHLHRHRIKCKQRFADKAKKCESRQEPRDT